MTIDLQDGWRLSNITNPNNTQYDGVYESYSNYNINNGMATMIINIKGLDKFTLYIRSYAESSYDYVMVSQLDAEITSST